jgi:CelD/BcsL family acetyltransferase involved in cellulose biosynthesis
MSHMTVEIIHPSGLPGADLATWRELQAATPAFGNPLLGPDFAQAVGAVRKDARVAIWRGGGGRASAFLAYHRRPQGFGRPIGAPFCDYHAVVGGGGLGLDSTAILSAAQLKAFRLSGLVDPFGVFGAAGLAPEAAYRIVVEAAPKDAPPSQAGAAYLEALKAGSANRFKNFRRYSKRLEQAFGPVRLVAEDLDVDAFERLLAWKRLQLARTGLHDVLRPAWVAALMRRLFQTPSPDKQGGGTGAPDQRFGGLMISLYAGDTHVAGHFGVRLGGWYHPWIGATAPNLESLGAGFVHQWKAVEAMGRLDLHTYDLGAGSDHWKRLFTSDVVEVGKGLVVTPTLGGRLARAGDQLWTTPPLNRIGLTARVRNRLDQIAAIEPAWSGRARGVLAMASALERRAASRRSSTCIPGFEVAHTPAGPPKGRTL